MISLLRRWRIKLFNWEYWPWQIVYFPVFIYYIFLALRSGSMLYISGANPGIRNGGMIGESKYDILSLIPAQYLPKSIRIGYIPENSRMLNEQLQTAGLEFPLIAKPDVGERGFMVKKIHSVREAEKYANQLGHPFILQEYIDLPVEAGIFYYRLPGDKNGNVSSVVLKKMLTIRGNGRDTMGQLIQSDDRAFLQLHLLQKKFASSWDHVPEQDQEIVLNSIGNHCLGTTFLDGNYLITPPLISTMDRLSRQVDGFYYGRFDIRAASLESIQAGDFKVLELNGAASEPAHIYQPGASFLKGQKSLFHHWRMMYIISRMNKERKQLSFPSVRESLREFRRFRMLKRSKKQ